MEIVVGSDVNQKTDHLEKSSLFKGVAAQDLALLAKSARHERYRKEEFILKSATQVDDRPFLTVFIKGEGVVQLQTSDKQKNKDSTVPNDKSFSTEILAAGDVVGELEIAVDAAKWVANIVAKTEGVEVLKIYWDTRDDIKRWLLDHPTVLWSLFTMSAHRLIDQAALSANPSVQKRMFRYLLNRSRNGEKANSMEDDNQVWEGRVAIFTQTEVAEAIASAPSVVNRCLLRMIEHKLVARLEPGKNCRRFLVNRDKVSGLLQSPNDDPRFFSTQESKSPVSPNKE